MKTCCVLLTTLLFSVSVFARHGCGLGRHLSIGGRCINNVGAGGIAQQYRENIGLPTTRTQGYGRQASYGYNVQIGLNQQSMTDVSFNAPPNHNGHQGVYCRNRVAAAPGRKIAAYVMNGFQGVRNVNHRVANRRDFAYGIPSQVCFNDSGHNYANSYRNPYNAPASGGVNINGPRGGGISVQW